MEREGEREGGRGKGEREGRGGRGGRECRWLWVTLSVPFTAYYNPHTYVQSNLRCGSQGQP